MAGIKEIISSCADRMDSFYLYDERRILERIQCLKNNFPQVDFLYSIKCNPNASILRSVFSQGLGADAASVGEVELACGSDRPAGNGESGEASGAGLPGNRIYFSAPGKSTKDIERVLGHCTLIADSIDEIRRIQDVCGRLGKSVCIGIRINPDFSFSGDRGAASKFGIDEEEAFAFLRNASCRNVKVTGIHVHLKSQELNAGVLAAYYDKVLCLAEKFASVCGEPDFVNMGSGMGIPGAASDSALDLLQLQKLSQSSLNRFRERHPGTKIIIETGRYVVGECGYYVTKVMDRKVSHEKTYLILKNTLNGFIRPSLARLVEKYSPELNPGGTEPLFTSVDAFRFLTLKEDAAAEKVTLVGNLCTAADIVAEDIVLPHFECGDVVIMTNAGSYAAVLSPMQFSSQERPGELFLSESGQIIGG